MRHITAGILLSLLLLLIGCSGHSSASSPVTPGDSLNPQSTGQLASSRQLLGLWDCMLNEESGLMEAIPLRQADFHLNVVKWYNENPDCLSITVVKPLDKTTGEITLDITLKHPFPQSIFRGFDVRGIIFGKGPDILSAKDDPDLMWLAPNGLRLLNADGWTRWWNPEEFTSTGLFGYTPGNSGSTSFQGMTTLNPYKYFSNALSSTASVSSVSNLVSRGSFVPVDNSSATRRYEIKFPVIGGKVQGSFQYAFDASWVNPTGDPPYTIEDFPTSANIQEAFYISVNLDESSVVYPDGGDLKIAVEVFDWGAIDNPIGILGEISTIKIESPTLFDSTVEVPLTVEPGSSPFSGIFNAFIPGVHPSGIYNQEILITVVADNGTSSYKPPMNGIVYPEDAALAAYSIVKVPISINPTITVTQPNGGESWLVGSKQYIQWSWTGTIDYVSIYYSTDGGSTYPYTIATWVSCTGSYYWNPIPNTPTSLAKVKIADASNGSVYDTSTSNFMISSLLTPTITLTAPNGGESWMVNSSQNITWNWTGSIANVSIYYSIDGGSSYPYTITSSTTCDGSYPWTILDYPTTSARVKIYDASNSSIYDTSNSSFTIYSSDGIIPEIEPNDILSQATTLPSGKTGTGIVSYPSDVYDWWKFTITQPTVVDINWIILTGDVYGRLRLYDLNGEDIDSDQSANGNTYSLHDYLEPGTWYLRFEQWGEYASYEVYVDAQVISVNESEPNDNYDEADNLTLGNLYNGVLIYPTNEYDWWKITIAQSGEYEVRWHIIDGEEYGNISLLDSVQSIVGTDSSPTNHYFSIQQPLIPGIYYIMLNQVAETSYYDISVVKL